jgi:hypothetical protein
MARSPKQLWFNELQELIQMLQAENPGLKTLLHVSKEENQRLQAMKMQIGEGSMNEMVMRPYCDHGNFTSNEREHESENACTVF